MRKRLPYVLAQAAAELANLRTAFRWTADHGDLLSAAATVATHAGFLGYLVELRADSVGRRDHRTRLGPRASRLVRCEVAEMRSPTCTCEPSMPPSEDLLPCSSKPKPVRRGRCHHFRSGRSGRCRSGWGVRGPGHLRIRQGEPSRHNCVVTSTSLGRNLEMRDRGLAIDEVLVILGIEHGGLDVGSCKPDDGCP